MVYLSRMSSIKIEFNFLTRQNLTARKNFCFYLSPIKIVYNLNVKVHVPFRFIELLISIFYSNIMNKLYMWRRQEGTKKKNVKSVSQASIRRRKSKHSFCLIIYIISTNCFHFARIHISSFIPAPIIL